MIKNQSYLISNQILTYQLLDSYFTKFRNEIFTPITTKNVEKHLMIKVKVSFNNSNFNYEYTHLLSTRRVGIILNYFY